MAEQESGASAQRRRREGFKERLREAAERIATLLARPSEVAG